MLTRELILWCVGNTSILKPCRIFIPLQGSIQDCRLHEKRRCRSHGTEALEDVYLVTFAITSQN